MYYNLKAKGEGGERKMKQTIPNLTKAFIGESQARNRYDFYAKIARKEGLEQIAEIFLITAENEKAHAKRIFEHIQELKKKPVRRSSKSEGGGRKKWDEIEVEATAPTIYGSTTDNLKAAIAGEHYEYTQMYPQFARVAKKEGLSKIANRLKAIAIAEKHHEERYKKLLRQVKAGAVFKKKKALWWVCRECGYIYFGKQPPKVCPSCDHEQGFYQVKCERY